MHPMEIVWLCIVCAVVGGLIGFGTGRWFWGEKCDHQFEKIVDNSFYGGEHITVVHMCKKCGKRKITRV